MSSHAETTRKDHRSYVGPREKYDLVSSSQFMLLCLLGLREDHSLLDIGCGSLRAGRLLMTYLAPGGYCGMEPGQWLIDEGIEKEVGRDLVAIKKPSFSNDADFTLTTFGRTFDFLLAQSIFSHATPAQIHRCLGEAKKVLAPRGLFAATYFRGEEDYTGTEWVYPGCVTYRPERMREMAAEAGLECVQLAWTHPNSQTWVALWHGDQRAAPEVADMARVPVLEDDLATARRQLAELRSLPGMKLVVKANRLLRGS